MRDHPDAPFAGWQPPAYTVDTDGKVVGAVPGEPHNWGRWGPLDQRGTANLLTAARARDAARLVRTGETFALGLAMGAGAPNPGTRSGPGHFMTRTAGDQVLADPGPHGLQSSDDVVLLPLQLATQLDGLAHAGDDDVLYNGFWAGLVTAQSGARRLGIHQLAGGIVGRGVLIDVAGVLDVDPFDTAIDAAMLDQVAAASGVRVGAGDVVLVRTGFLSRWLADPEARRRRRQSGLLAATIDWLARRDVAMVAADNRAVEVIPDPDGRILPWHVAALRDLGLMVGELFDLDALAAACRADGVYEFLFAAMPMPLVNAVGSPLNPVAVK